MYYNHVKILFWVLFSQYQRALLGHFSCLEDRIAIWYLPWTFCLEDELKLLINHFLPYKRPLLLRWRPLHFTEKKPFVVLRQPLFNTFSGFVSRKRKKWPKKEEILKKLCSTIHIPFQHYKKKKRWKEKNVCSLKLNQSFSFSNDWKFSYLPF